MTGDVTALAAHCQAYCTRLLTPDETRRGTVCDDCAELMDIEHDAVYARRYH